MIGARARSLELCDVGEIIGRGALSDAAEELRKAVAVFEQNRRTRRLRRDVELGNAIEAVLPQQFSHDRITRSDGIDQAGENVVAID